MDNIYKLLEVMQCLRDKESGCPWDLEQDFRSIAPYTIEEAYEVADAIRRDDMTGLREELGDLLLQVVFHARMAAEAGLFDFNDVAGTITAKMQRRHPHVFGSSEQVAAGMRDGSWEAIKAGEREARDDPSALAGVALALPALKRAEKLGKRAATVGFDWDSRSGVREKIQEELEELSAAAASRDTVHIREEVGELMFTIVNLARHLQVDPEEALVGANDKFERRFRDMEQSVVDGGQRLKDLSAADLERAWRSAKRRLSGKS
jgi:nucleoside triphosphate diphosphatase